MTILDFRRLKEMAYTLTDEQVAIVRGAKTGANMKIEAGAGAGKTSTLREIGNVLPEQAGILIAYNKAIAEDAKASFPRNVACSTAHSLAFRAVGRNYSQRLNAGRMPGRVRAQMMGIRDSLFLSGDREISAVQLSSIVMQTVDKFCHSAETGIRSWHVPFVNGVVADDRDQLESFILPYAERAWADVINPDGRLPFTHDNYLKIWGLTNPQLNADFVMLDEAQDANPVIAAIVEAQTNAQRILVGDRNQAIYGWRGALNAMRDFSGDTYYLTQSFRFGPAIADEANKWLTYLDAELRIKGFDKITSTTGPIDAPSAVLCRTNGGAMTEVITRQVRGQRVALVGGGESIRRLAVAADDLRRGLRTEHPELFAFKSWDEVKEYVNEPGTGSDLRVFVKMIEDYGTQKIIDACSALGNESDCDIVVSTAHKAKGREWHSVQIANDFKAPKDETNKLSAEEAMLAYVSVTRAKQHLDATGLSFIDSLLAEQSGKDAAKERA